MPVCHLPDRGVVSVSGPEARNFLDNVLTVSMEGLTKGDTLYGGLLTPQGKIVVDGIIFPTDAGVLIDCPRLLAGDLARRLGFYKLRAKIEIANLSDDMAVYAGWGSDPSPHYEGYCANDPRLSTLGERILVAAAQSIATDATENDYHAHRIALGVPEGGRDFVYGDSFPHEADMDQLHGIDFGKGCYVGQEVVSRMQHRGTARTRCMPVRFSEGTAPTEGTEALAGEKICGRIGSSTPAGQAIALLRLDRIAEAIKAGDLVSAGGYSFSVERRDWMRFDLEGIA